MRDSPRNPEDASILAEDRTLFEGLFEFAPDAILVVAPDGRIQRMNAQAEAMFGYSRGEAIGKPVEMLVPARVRDRHTQMRSDYTAHPRVRPMGTGLELCGTRQDGAEFPIEVALGPLRTEQGTVVLAAVRDVTDRKRAEKALRDSEQRLQAILDNSPAVIYVKDGRGRYLLINRRYEELFRVRREEVAGKTDLDLWAKPVAEAFMANDRKVLAADGPIQFEELAPHDDGPHTYVSVKFPLRDSAGYAYAVCGISTDITDRKQAEEAVMRAREDLEVRVRGRTAELAEANRRLVEEQSKLIQAEKLSSIGLLAAGVAHEINNPLSGVMGCIKALHEGSLREPKREEYFQTAREGLDRIKLTVQGLLDFARQRPPAATRLDAEEVVSACLRLIAPVARRKNVEIDLRLRSGEIWIRADRSQLMQAAVNVLMNAVYAAPAGTPVEVSALPADGRVGIRVADRGPGIPRELLARACDPFFTTKPEGEGTGLGLAITLGIVRAHGGDLDIESDSGRGTTVTMWLPSPGGDVKRG